MGALYQTILYDPLFNGLMALYHFLPGKDLGVAIILLTFVIKCILFWPSLSSLKAQRALQELQPKLAKLQQQHKGNREVLGKETMRLYRENKVNPLSSCLPSILQLLILIPLYQAFLNGLKTDPDTHLLVADQLRHLYPGLRAIFSEVSINTVSFGFLNLASRGGIVLGIIAGGLQFWQTRMLSRKPQPKVEGAKDENIATAMNRQMLYLFPLLSVWLVSTFPAGVGIYWVASTLFQLGQQFYFFRRHAVPKVTVEPPKPAAQGGGQVTTNN